jgi:hypothetical protein
MPLYRLSRHVIYRPGCQQTEEVWGVDRRFTTGSGLETRCGPRDTDEDDPLRRRDCCAPELLWHAGGYVPWGCIWEWLSVAEAAGYEVVSGFKKMSPYSVIVLRGP